jgi:hypothetical protein
MRVSRDIFFGAHDHYLSPVIPPVNRLEPCLLVVALRRNRARRIAPRPDIPVAGLSPRKRDFISLHVPLTPAVSCLAFSGEAGEFAFVPFQFPLSRKREATAKTCTAEIGLE